jgi:hypothetical protein
MDPSGAVGLDESPSGLPLPPPRSTGRSLFYRRPEEPEAEEESSLPPAEAAEDGDGGSDSGHPSTTETFELLDDSEPDSWTASPAGERPAQLLGKAQLRATTRTAVKVGTGVAHTVAAKTEAQQAVGLYLADDDDAKAIGDPLADIAYRRGDVVGGKLSPDANDLLRSMMGVAGYFAKQVAKIGEVRRIEAAQTAGEVQHFPTEGLPGAGA